MDVLNEAIHLDKSSAPWCDVKSCVRENSMELKLCTFLAQLLHRKPGHGLSTFSFENYTSTIWEFD